MGFNSILRRGKPPFFLKLRSSAGLIVTTASFAVFTVRSCYILLRNPTKTAQDVFLYAVIVPVLPFSLVDRAGIEEDRSKNNRQLFLERS